MSPEDVERLFIRAGEKIGFASEVEVRWHAGEPLILGPAFYRDVIARIERWCPPHVTVSHSLQTNATLIDNDWCSLFHECDIRVGISLDWPPTVHDTHRVRRNGKGTWDETLQGMTYLKANGVPFEIISVLTTESLDEPESFCTFLTQWAPRWTSLHIEESEGSHVSDSLQDSSYFVKLQQFIGYLVRATFEKDLHFREIDEAISFIRSNVETRENLLVQPFSIVSVDVNGYFSTYSPELLSLSHPGYPTFIVGNLFQDSLKHVVASESFQHIRTDVDIGVQLCHKSCEYFFYCGGGAPSNKVFENGTFASTETTYCRFRIKLIMNAVISYFRQFHGGHG